LRASHLLNVDREHREARLLTSILLVLVGDQPERPLGLLTVVEDTGPAA